MEYQKLFKALHDTEIQYLICGGLAVNIYGIPRMTADIDIILSFKEENLKLFQDVIKKQDYSALLPLSIEELQDDQVRLKLEKEKNLLAFSYFNSSARYMTLDVLLKFPFSFEALWERREVRKTDDFSVNLVSLKDLIAMKRYSNRTQDQSDVKLLSQILNER